MKHDPFESMKDILPGQAERYAKRDALAGDIAKTLSPTTVLADKESDLAFVERMPDLPADIRPVERVSMPGEDYIRLRALAKTAALIDEHRLDVLYNEKTCIVTGAKESQFAQTDSVHTAVRAVADRIK